MFSMDIFGPVANGRAFDMSLKCYSMSMHPEDKQNLENGNKILLPPCILEILTRSNIEYPMMFKISSTAGLFTHCGVMEFVSEEGRAYIPYWMMRMLAIDQGEVLRVQYVQLPKATHGKFEPQSVDFLDISNPKAVLENALRNFSCLTKNDVISISYNDHIYELRVVEIKPADAVSIIEVDLNTEFEKPVGYVDPEVDPPTASDASSVTSLNEEEQNKMLQDAVRMQGFTPFSGGGLRLDGKSKNTQTPLKELAKNVMQGRGIPDYDYKPGFLKFQRNVAPTAPEAPATEENDAPPSFQGEGFRLKKKKTQTK